MDEAKELEIRRALQAAVQSGDAKAELAARRELAALQPAQAAQPMQQQPQQPEQVPQQAPMQETPGAGSAAQVDQLRGQWQDADIMGGLSAMLEQSPLVQAYKALQSGQSINPQAVNPAVSAVETGATLASGALGAAAGGLAGIGQGVANIAGVGDGTSAADRVEQVQSALTYEPRTTGGQASLEQLAPVGSAIEFATDVPATAAAAGAEALGADEQAQAAIYGGVKAIPEALGAALGSRAAVRQAGGPEAASEAVRRAPAAAAEAIPQRPSRREAAKLLQQEQFDAPTAKFELSPTSQPGAARPRVQLVPEYAEAVRQGFDEGVVAAMKEGSPRDVAMMKDMVNIRQRQKQNALYNKRATDVAGDALASRVNFVIARNKQAGAELDNVAKGLRGQQVDVSPAVDQFLADLDNMGIRLDGNLRPIFDGSDIEGLTGVQNVVSNIVKRMKSGRAPDAYDAHRLKRFIDEQVSYGKTQEGMSGQVERVLKNLRRNIDSKLDESFPEYDAVNTQYAETITALDAIQDAMGAKVDFDSARADKSMGTRLRALWSNQQGRVGMEDAIDLLDDTAARYGGEFDTNVRLLSRFAQELDRVFGAEAQTSLKGQVNQAVDIPRTLTELGVGAVQKGYDKVRGINEANQFKAINSALDRRSAAQ